MIFGCGLSRTGNKSLGDALRIIGYNPIKYPKSINDLGTVYDAAVDITVVAWLDELNVKFPEARWILTTRDLESWLKSCDRWFSRSLDQYSQHKQAYLRYYRTLVYGTETFDPEVWQAVYRQHLERIMTKFQGRESQLLIINICKGDSWDELCSFLDKLIPDAAFPRIS